MKNETKNCRYVVELDTVPTTCQYFENEADAEAFTIANKGHVTAFYYECQLQGTVWVKQHDCQIP